MIARLLNQCGLYLGPSDRLLKANAANPLGHFEHKGFLDIDRKLLKHFKATWHEPPELRPNWHLEPALDALRADAQELAASFAGQAPWGWKEPRACLFLPFWKQAIPGMRFVMCVRNPLEVARSLEKRNHIPIDKGAELWCRYVRQSFEDTEGSPRLLLFFEDFFSAGEGEIERLLDFCGLSGRGAGLELRSLIAGELRHHRSALQSLLEEPRITSRCKHLYLGLRAIRLSQGENSRERGDDHQEQDSTVSALMQTFKGAAAPNTGVTATASGDAGTFRRFLASLKRS